MNEENLEFYNKGIKEGRDHSSPSKETQRRLGGLETKLNVINTNCAKHNVNNELMRRDISDIKEYIKEDMQWKKDFEEKANAWFAKKWVEKVVTSIIVIFALAALWLIFDKAGLPH